MNWHTPFVWGQVEMAAVQAGKPRRPRDIMREAKKLNPTVFDTLTEQVVGRWIDKEAKQRGVSRWSKEALEQVAKGNSPGGETTRVGILVSNLD